MNRVVHFEIPAEDVSRASKFYADVFGWTFHKWDGPMEYHMISTGPDGQPGINGGMMPRRDPQQPVVNTVDVADLDESIEKVTSAGGQIVVPKMPIPGVGWLAYFKDTEGHIFGIMQNDPSAK